jgi:factor associated with neutral sphingomyelinase activation
MKKALSVLHPHRYLSQDDVSSSLSKQRFSPLLLEHGEQELQDWGVCASSHRVKKDFNFHPEPVSSTANIVSPTKKSHHNANSKKEKEPSAHMKSVEGRLRLCSKSLVFEPNDISRAIIRIPFEKMANPPKQDENAVQPSNTITFQSTRITVMMKNNIIAPYENIDRLVQYTFTFLHSTSEKCLSLLNKIFSVSSLSELQDTIQPILDQTFDSSNFHHVSEQPQTSNLRAYVLSPLRKQVGCAMISNERFYFQPFNGVYAAVASKALSWKLSDIVATARRYHGLKDEALELFFEKGPSLLIAFEGYANRELVMNLLPRTRSVGGQNVEIFCHTDVEFLNKVVTSWRSGNIENFDYLLALNSAAGRSFQDLSRYPVFPWVLSDYTSDKLNLESNGPLKQRQIFRDLSKPIGALNEERLQNFQDRFKGMQKDMGDSFLFGTHYSAPGYCLYYLVRIMPEQMLCLQNGKYDAPDRLFFDICNCYSSILTNPADVKECIPQFYDTKTGMEMLVNTRGLQLGVTQNSIIIGDVKLPKWAKNPKDFIKKNRNALESDYCTAHLPSWIDLIFGFKARGDMALEAKNLFHPTSYLTPKDLEKMETEEEKMQAELQAIEFGICPDVLFTRQHPMKGDMVTTNDSFLVIDNGRISQLNQLKTFDALNTIFSPSKHAHKTTMREKLLHAEEHLDTNVEPESNVPEDHAIIEAIEEQELYAKAKSSLGDATIGDNAVQFAKETLQRNMDTMSLSGSGESLQPSKTISQRGTFGSDEKTKSSLPSHSYSEVDDTLINNENHGNWKLKKITSSQIHGEAVTGCILSTENESIVVTTSLDGDLMAHTLPCIDDSEKEERHGFSITGDVQNSTKPTLKERSFHNFRSHHSSDPLSCLALINDQSGGHIVFAGGHDDIVLAYGINSACGLSSIYAHRDVVTAINVISFPLKDGSSHVMLTSSWDATVKLWAVTVAENEHVKMIKEPIDEFYDAESQVECLDTLCLPDGEILIAAGCTDGFIVWSWSELKSKTMIYKGKTNTSCSVLKWIWTSFDQAFLLVSFDDGHVCCYILKKNEMYPVSKRNIGSQVTCATPPSSMTSELFMGCEDGTIRILRIGENGHLDENPVVFSSAQGMESKKVTSIAVSRCCREGNQYTVVTGAEDGSISLYILEEQC